MRHFTWLGIASRLHFRPVKKPKKARAEKQGWQDPLEEFFRSDLAEKAASSLGERASIALHVEGDTFHYQRKKGKNVLVKAKPAAPDVEFWIPASAMRHLLAMAQLPDTSLATMGIAVFEHLFSGDEARKIKFRVHTGFLGLWSKGYFSVLKAGGPEVASYLGRWGFNSLARIKTILQQMRG